MDQVVRIFFPPPSSPRYCSERYRPAPRTTRSPQRRSRRPALAEPLSPQSPTTTTATPPKPKNRAARPGGRRTLKSPKPPPRRSRTPRRKSATPKRPKGGPEDRAAAGVQQKPETTARASRPYGPSRGRPRPASPPFRNRRPGRNAEEAAVTAAADAAEREAARQKRPNRDVSNTRARRRDQGATRAPASP